MPLANGRHTLAIPGPSIMPDRVLQAMHRPAPNIYTGEIVDLAATLVPDLKAVARTSHAVAMYIGNGHAVWEASLVNVLAPGDKVLVPATGNFSNGWAEMARRLGIEVEVIDYGRRAPLDPGDVVAALSADKSHEIKAVLCVQTDTATSVKSDVAALGAAMRETGHPALLMVDCIACLGCDELQMDDWGVDVMVAGCQKGLMTPPGMGFVFFNDRASVRRAQMERVSSYWDWVPRANPEQFYQYWCGTAPTHHLYGLREALNMIVHEEGIEQVWARHAYLARAVWAACDVWGSEGPLEMNIADAAHRSNAVTSVRIGAPTGTQLRSWLTEEMGLTLGIGLGMATEDDPKADGFFRIGHMGHLSGQMLLGTLGAIEAGLVALQIPHGTGGVQAAAEVCAAAE